MKKIGKDVLKDYPQSIEIIRESILEKITVQTPKTDEGNNPGLEEFVKSVKSSVLSDDSIISFINSNKSIVFEKFDTIGKIISIHFDPETKFTLYLDGIKLFKKDNDKKGTESPISSQSREEIEVKAVYYLFDLYENSIKNRN